VINSHTNILSSLMMQIIPVIDLLNGVVVHAKRGQRAAYQPIQSQLTASSAPLDIVAALLALYPFTQLYIADLNAIQKLGGDYSTNFAIIEAIAQRYPALELWIDAGISNNTELAIWQKLNARLIIGSENFASIGNYCALNNKTDNFILSLDFFAQGYQGPAELLTNSEYWPQDVIVMSLANVGANQGANVELLQEMLDFAPTKNLYAAGGVRGLDDLEQLKKMGMQGALIATALHQNQIPILQLTDLCQ
jgi:phosphoribosylformimino-5-aminoimidazole carboxamide ribotide isomerase